MCKTRLKGEYKLPISEAEPPEPSPEWKWHTPDSALETVLAGNSIFISGIGGTGKSYTMTRMVEQLQANRGVSSGPLATKYQQDADASFGSMIRSASMPPYASEWVAQFEKDT